MGEYITLSVLEKFLKSFSRVKDVYERTKDIKTLENGLKKLTEEYHEYFGVWETVLSFGEELILSGARDAGISVFKMIEAQGVTVANQALFCMRLAENALKNGNIDECKSYLLTLCERIDNYEDAIEANELRDVWDSCKHIVEKDVCMQKSLTSQSTDKCSMTMKEIIKLPRDEFITALYDHLDELSAGGQRLELFSEQGFFVYITLEFIEAINADGLEHYFSYSAEHFTELHRAFIALECAEAEELWRRIWNKILNAVDTRDGVILGLALSSVEDRKMDFEGEEDIYYKRVEKKLLQRVYEYTLKNSAGFERSDL